MPIDPFKLERYFALHEFTAKYLLSPSDCESLSVSELLQLADGELLTLWNELTLGYTESPGHPLLRAEVARLYQQIDPDDVLTAVPEEAIFIAMQTLLTPGDHVVTIFPAYQSLYEVARSSGCAVTPWPLELGTGGWQLNLDRLEHSLTDRTRLLVLNFPHNPTGYLPSRGEFEALIEIARQHDLYIFCDEMYRLLEYDPADRLPPICDLYEKGISLSGLSKTFALPGLRLGWLAMQGRALLTQWLSYKDYTTICNSAPSEVLGIMALRAKDAIITRNLDIIRHNLQVAEQFFAAHADRFAWIKPHAGSIAFPRWLAATPVEEFCEDVLTQQNVMIVPGRIFDYPGNHFRVGLGRRNLAEALQRVDDYLRSGVGR
jgi:aspartate/methionine/tyrosine aminotransferase